MLANLIKSSSVLALLAAIAVVSCQGPEEEEQPPLPPIGSIMGAWQIHETFGVVSSVNCVRSLIDYVVYVAQNGSTVIAEVGFDTTIPLNPTIGSDGTLSGGTINGSTLAFSGVNPDGGGTMSTASVASVAATCNSLTGTQTFSTTATSCSGTIQFVGTRIVGSGCGGTIAATAVPESSTAHNTAATAQVITRPAEVSGTIVSGEDDWYSFTLSAAAAVTILLNGPAAPQNIDLFLRDDGDTTTLASSTSPSSREAVADTLGAGAYRIRVTSTAVTGTASYKLLVQ